MTNIVSMRTLLIVDVDFVAGVGSHEGGERQCIVGKGANFVRADASDTSKRSGTAGNAQMIAVFRAMLLKAHA